MKEIIAELKKPFPPAAHKERKLPGGDRWFYIPWQLIRDRLDEVCEEWECSYSQPFYLDHANPKKALCCITCTISIEGHSRQGVGNAEIELISGSGKDMGRGTPVERAVADAFKNAAEAWGVGRYLDDQAEVTRLLQRSGDGRAVAFAAKNQNSYTRKTGEISREQWLSQQRGN
jgi:hypothetical protein